MGQRSSRCKKAEKDFGRVHFHHGTPPPSFTCLVEAHPHPVGVGEENVAGEKKKTRKEDSSKKKKRFRLWSWTSCFCWTAGQKYSRKSSSAQSEEEAQGTDAAAPPGRIPDVQCFLQQVICSVENHNHQEPSTTDPDIPPAAEEHLAVHPDADVLQSLGCSDNVVQTVSNWSADITQTPVLHTVSNWSINAGLTPVFNASNWCADVTQTPARTASDWSIDVSQTPARTASDWSIDITRTPERTASDWSIDVIRTPERTASDWSIDVIRTPELKASDWSNDFTRTPERTASDWSIDVIRTPEHTASDRSIDVTRTPERTASDWSIDFTRTPERTASDWSIDITRTPELKASDWSIDITRTPELKASDWSNDFTRTPERTASDWSIDFTRTPELKASDWSIDITRTPERTASDWSIDFTRTPELKASDWSIDITRTPERTASDWSIDFTRTSARTASDWSIDVTQTPACTASDWSADIAQTPVRGTPSDWSIDVIQTLVRTASNWSIDVTQTQVHTTFDWNANVTQTPECTASDWSIDVGQKPFSPTELSVSPLTRELENNKNKTVVINSHHYVISDMLGEGTFGVVYDGSRLLDGFKVAVKIVQKTEDLEYLSIPDHSMPLPLEVALLMLANRGPSVPEIIQLLDWKDQHDYYIMVLEHPSPCEDLFGFTERYGGSIDEGLARVVMQQATQAAYMCCRRGVLHRDIKLENLLINKETHEVKLIDFGCGDLLRKSAYKIFTGTDEYCPPEYEEKGEYNGKPATVWSLGVLLFALVSGDYPNTDDLHMINANSYSQAGLSEECCHLISSCLQREPEQRLQLSEMLLHDWFKVTNVENLKTV